MTATEDNLVKALRAAAKENLLLTKANAELAAAAREPIAIVGMGVRLPGGVSGPDDLWDLLCRGGDAIGEFPADRGWDADGTTYTRRGGFLYDADLFDPGFFGISPREALAMDPQQRLLLETSWEALEYAGLNPSALGGQNIGVYTGLFAAGYGGIGTDLSDQEGAASIGVLGSVAAGRVSYTLGLHGPAVTVDTACSSSLVALHLASQALRSGECTMALAGGATVMATPFAFLDMARQRGLASDGRCRSFADAADGAGFSEGVGVLVLQRLSDAQRDGREILAVIRGSAVNQDGASNGLTAPNGPAQQAVIRQALANAGLTPADVDAVEAHGTGTTLGDPIEAQALLATYGHDHSSERPLLLGSLKSNIGHTQAAAGVAGVIKMILALRHGTLPRTLHIDQPTTKVDWTAGSVRLLTEPEPWPQADRPRRAGISSFGVSGTNAHLILEQAPAPQETAASTDVSEPPLVPLVVTGRSAPGLAGQAQRLADYLLDQRPGLIDTAAALVTTRAQWEHRAVVITGNHADAVAALHSLAAGAPGPRVVHGIAETFRARDPVVLVFPGQDSWWAGMAIELLESSAVFREAMAECEAALSPYLDWSLTEVARGAAGAPPLERVDVLQPVLWAVMVSLARVWRSYGVRPAAVLGHSQGEIAAACVAGALSLADGARVVAVRSRLIAERLSGHGAMLSVRTTPAKVRSVLGNLSERVSIAAINGPTTVTLSGRPDDIVAVERRLSAAQIRRLPVAGVDFAAHSEQVQALAAELAELLAPVTPRPATVPFYSTVTGGQLDTTGLDAEYWYRNLRETVNFDATVRALLTADHNVFVEVSPHPVFAMGIGEIAESVDGTATVVGSLRRDDGGLGRFLASAAELYVHGVPIAWPAVIPPPGRRLRLPTTAFQRRRYWMTASTTDAANPVGRDVLYRVAWTQLPPPSRPDVPAADTIETTDGLLVPAGHDSPPWVLFHATSGPADLSERLRDLVGRTLRAVHVFLAEPAWERSRLIIHTHGAVDLDAPVDPASAAVWGLVRTAQTEHPDRFVLLDAAPAWGNAGALAGMWQQENQFALREDTWWTPRLVSAADEPGSTELNPDGTVLITGGTGGIGAVVARHLAAEHGIRHLILASRRGADADGAAELRADLEASGAHIDIVACDVADRDQVRALLARVRADAPLTAVIHSAAVTDDGVITAFDAARLDTVFAPKADGAVHLDELTREEDLAAFVLFSSISGVVGAPGQGNYAAANAFLDALATRRRAAGYPAISLAWGLWSLASGLAGGRDLTTDAALLKRFGLRPIDPPQGLRLFDVALRSPRATLAPVALDVAALRAQARSYPMPTVLHAVIGPVRRTAGAAGPDPGTLRTRLAGLDTAGRLAALTELVQAEAAAEIGYDTPQDIGARRPFRQFGFDSLTAVGLRNRLTRATGVRLPAALIYDHETPAAVADLLLAGLAQDSTPAPAGAGDLSFGQVYRTLLELNRHDDMQRLGLAAAAGRVTFDHSGELDGGARIIRLSEGGQPHLICIPPVTSVNAMTYSRLANHFAGRNDLSVIMPPGFAPGEPLASSFDVLVEALAEAAVRCAQDTPFVLMGISGGGCLAHSVAEHLERGGVKPEAVIYLDSYLPDAVSPRLLEFLVQEYPRQEEFLGEYDYPKITAAAVYTSMLEGWQPRPVLASALVLRPAEPLPGPGGSTEPLADHEWHTEWPLAHDEVQVPGHHFSMCTTYAAATAEAIGRWLTDSYQEKGTST